MKNTTKKVLIGTAAAATGAAVTGALTYAVVKKLVSVALDREQPKNYAQSQRKLSGSSEMLTLPDGFAECAARLEHSCQKTVEIEGHDGIKLIGHWHQAEHPKRTIIAMHGWRSSWIRDFAMCSDFWQQNDCNVLYAEQRGQGKSDGEYMGFGLIERYDCLDWIHFVNDNGCAELPIYLCGVSMGASTVLMASGFDLPDNVHGIIADCGFTSPHAIWKHVVETNLRIPYGGVAGAIADDLCKRKIRVGSKDFSTVDALNKCIVPVLFIHGTDDSFVPIEMTYENYKACASPKRLFVVPGADHAYSYIVDKKGYEETVKSFWRDYDISCIC